MSKVIDGIREKYPQYKDIPDDELALRIGGKYPTYLEQDSDFKNEFQQAAGQRSLDLALKGTGEVLKIITNPAAGEASEMGREQAQAQRLSYGIEAPIAATGIVQTMLARGAAAAPSAEELAAQKSDLKFGEDLQKMGPSAALAAVKGRLTKAVGEAGKAAFGLITSPLVELMPKISAADIEKYLVGTAPGMPYAIARERAVGATPTEGEQRREFKPEDFLTPQAKKLIGTVTGTQQAIADQVNFFTSPLGIATLGMGSLPPRVAKLVGLGFTIQMASQAPEIASQLGEEFGKPEEQRDPEKIARLVTEGTLATGFTAGGALHLFEPQVLRARERQAARREFKAALDQMFTTAPATATALKEQVDIEPAELPVPKEHSDIGVVSRQKISGKKDRVTIKTESGEQSYEGSPQAIDAILAKMGKPKEAGAATEPAPVTEPAEKGVTPDASKIGKATEVHGDVSALTGEGAGGMPAAEGGEGIRPQAEGGLQAQGTEGVLKKETPQIELAGQKVKRVAAMDIDSFVKHVAEVRGAGGLQVDAHRTGATIESPEDLDNLRKGQADLDEELAANKKRIEQLKAETKAETDPKAKGEKTQEMMGLLNQQGLLVSKRQWFSEAIDAAIGSADAGRMEQIKKDVGPDYKPPFPGGKPEELQAQLSEETGEKAPTAEQAIEESLQPSELPAREPSEADIKKMGEELDKELRASSGLGLKDILGMMKALEETPEDFPMPENVRERLREYIADVNEGKKALEDMALTPKAEEKPAEAAKPAEVPPSAKERLQKKVKATLGQNLTKADQLVGEHEAHKGGIDDPEKVKLRQQIGAAIDPRLRLGDQEEIGRAYTVYKQGGATLDEVNALLKDRQKSLGLEERPIPTVPAAKFDPNKLPTEKDLAPYLKVETVDVGEAKEAVKFADRQIKELRDQAKAKDDEINAIERQIMTGKGFRRRIKQSARKMDIARRTELITERNKLLDQARGIEVASQKDRTATELESARRVINDESKPLLYRLIHRRRLYYDQKQEPPADLVKAINDLETAEFLKRYPDATPEEIKNYLPEVDRAAHFNPDLDREFQFTPTLNLHNQRRAVLEGVVNKIEVPFDQFSEALQEKINRFTPAKRPYSIVGTKPGELEKLSSADLADIQKRITQETGEIKEAARVAEEKRQAAEEKAKAEEAALMAKAQEVADSAPRAGRPGGRSAAEVKKDLVERVKGAITNLIAENGVSIEDKGEGNYTAQSADGAVWALGTIEKTDKGSYKATAWHPAFKDAKQTATFPTLEEAQWLIKAMAAEGGAGKVIIAVPGDGVFRLVKSGKTLLKVWNDARGLEVSATPPKGYTETLPSKTEGKQFLKEAAEEAAKPTAPEAPKAPVAPETPEGATPTEDAVSKAFPDATYEQVKLAIQAVNEANYPEFSSRAEAIQKKYLQLATKAQTPDYGPFGNVKSAKALDELLSKPVPEKAPKPEEKPPGIKAAVMGEGPVQAFYGDGHFITIAIDAPSMAGITEQKIIESLPALLRADVKKVERFKASVVPGPKGAALGPSKARLYFKTQEAAQKAFDYFKGETPPAEAESAAPKFTEGQKVWVGQEPMHREGVISGTGPKREGVQEYFVKTNLGEVSYKEGDIRPREEGPAPAPGDKPGTADPRTLSDEQIKAELQAISERTAPLYAQLEAMPEGGYSGKGGKPTPEAKAILDQIQPWSDRKSFLDFETKRRADEATNKAMGEARDKRVAEAPVYQKRNGWEIVKEGVDYVMRHPGNKQDYYRGKLSRVREVADQSKPDMADKGYQPEEPPAPAQKYRMGDNPTLYSIIERLPQSEAEKANGEQPVKVRNENTGKEETVMESDLKPVKERTAEEKAKSKGEKRDLDQELRDLGMDPSVFKTKQDKQAAIIRENQKKQGPGTPHITQPADPKAPITALEESFRNVRGREIPISERVKGMFALGERIAAARDAVTQGIAGLKVTGDYLIDKWKSFDRLDDFLKNVGELSAEIEKNSWRMKQFVKTIERVVPDKGERAAIRKWVDAGGNMESLIAGFEEAPPEYKQHYLDAMDLSGDLLIGAMNIRNYFEARLEAAIEAGVLKEGVEDYIHRLYERNPEAEQRMLAYVQSGLLKTNPALIKKRIFDHDWEAERLGYRPVQDFLPAITTYESSLTRAIAAREFIRKITGYEDENGNKVPGLLAADGRPVVDVAGLGIPLEDQNGVPEGTLIKPSGLAKGKVKLNPVTQEPEVDPLSVRSDYAIRREYPAFRNWKWVANDTGGNPIFVHGDLAIHPDFVHRFDDLLKPSQVRYNPRPITRAIGRAALGVSSFAKQSLLDLSMFHQVQIEVHAAEHRVYAGPGPAPPGFTKVFSEINLDDPKMDGIMRGGLTIGGDYTYDPYYAEGLLGRSISRAVPGLREVMETYHQYLFQDLIPRIKATMAYEAFDRNVARYQKELQNGTMTIDDINHLTATQANAAFGGLNYRLLERSKTMQDLARIVFLAPDFLEARARFTAQAGVKYGNEQLTALFLGAVTMWSVARVANMLISGQPHNEPDNLFSVVINGKSWGLRTVQGDILHLAEHPIQFWMSRLNPVFGRTLLEAATGRDYFGRKRTALQQAWDAASTLIPASVRFSNERSIWEALANSMGITARRFSDVDDAFKLAQKWKDTHGVGMKGEFIYDPNKDDLRGLKVALSNADEAGAARELRKLIDAKKYTIPKINTYFDRYGNMPFTGSEKNDREWMKTLSDDEKKTVEAAREHKKGMRKLWHDIRDKYLQAQQHPEQQNEGQESETDTNAPAPVVQ